MSHLRPDTTCTDVTLLRSVKDGFDEHIDELESGRWSNATFFAVFRRTFIDGSGDLMPTRRAIILDPSDGAMIFIMANDIHFIVSVPVGDLCCYVLSTTAKRYQPRVVDHPLPSLTSHGVTSEMIVKYGERLTLNEYKARFAPDLWFPTRQEYIAWLKSLKAGAGYSSVVKLL